MKLLYVTSISYPSEFANRLQILAMSKEFGRLLGSSFCLGVNSLRMENTNFTKMEFGGPYHSPVLAWKYFSYIRQNGFTHIYCREDRLCYFLMLYAKLFRLPLKCYFEAHSAKPNYFFKSVNKKAHGIVAITAGIKSDLMKLGIPEQKILVAHDAVDLSVFDIEVDKKAERSKLNIPDNAIVAAYIGKYTTMGKKKGVDEIILAFAKARLELPELRLLVVGLSTKELPLVTSFCKSRGLPESSIFLVTYAPTAEVAKYMKISDILIMNYPNTEHYSKYMSPLKLFEYMASKVAILTSDLPTIREVLDDESAFFFPADDPARLSKALVDIGPKANLREMKALLAYEKVRDEYTWVKRVERILTFIRG